MKYLPTRKSPACLMAVCLVAASPLSAQSPPRFYDEGAVPSSNVLAGVWIEGDSEPLQTSDGAILAKDGSGNLFVGQGSGVTKYAYSEVSGQWEVLWQRNYISNQVSSQQYVTAPTVENPSPPVRHTIIYVEYWLSGPEQNPARYYQPGKNGHVPPGANILATYQYVDDGGNISVEIDERDRAFGESPFSVKVRAMTTDSAGNLYLGVTNNGFRESVLVTKFAPDGDVIWGEQTVPHLADGKESLVVDDVLYFGLSSGGDKLHVVESVDESNLTQLNSLTQQSHRRTVFSTMDDIGPGIRRIHLYGGVATAYRVANSVIPLPGWLNNAPYVASAPIAMARDASERLFGLFRESDPEIRVSPEGDAPFGVTDDRWVLRAYDSDMQPLEGKIQFFRSMSFVPRTIAASGDGEVFVIGDDVDTVTGGTTAQVIRYQYSAAPAPGFSNLWIAEAGDNTNAGIAVRTLGEITIAGHNPDSSGGWHVARFNDAGNLLWKRSSPGSGTALQRYKVTASVDGLLVGPDGETHILGYYSDYMPDFGNSLKSFVPYYTTYANDGDLQYVRLLEDDSLLDPSVASLMGGETISPRGSGAILRNGQVVVPALRRRFGVAEENVSDFQAVILALSNPDNANVDAMNITNATTITVDGVGGSFSVPLTTNHPIWRCYGLDPTSPIIVGGSLVGQVYQPAITGSNLAYGTYQQLVVAEGGQGASVKMFTVHVKPADVSITGEPADQVVRRKGSVNLQVFAQGDAPIYQWQVKVGTGWQNVTGATQPILRVSNVTSTLFYRCRVYNRIGQQLNSEVFSRAAKLTPDTERPKLAVNGPSGGKTTAKSVKLKGLAFDNLEVASLTYQIQVGGGKFSKAKNVKLTQGTILRGFTLTVPTAKPGTHKVKFVVKDTSGNSSGKTLVITRNK